MKAKRAELLNNIINNNKVIYYPHLCQYRYIVLTH